MVNTFHHRRVPCRDERALIDPLGTHQKNIERYHSLLKARSAAEWSKGSPAEKKARTALG